MRFWSAAAMPPLLYVLLTSGPWRAMPADGVDLQISREASALRLDFDFHGHGGYAIARRDGAIDLPENFEFTFRTRGEAPPNTLEFKLIDPSGENVWWTTRRDFEFPSEWKRISIKKRHIAFAWGPAGGGDVPKRIGALEIVITAGRGGKGTVWIDELTLSPLETTSELPPPFGPRSGRTIKLDLGKRREFGGFTIDWSTNFARDYSVATSIDGKEWETIRKVRGGNGGRDDIAIPDGDARYIQLQLDTPRRIRELALKPVSWSKTPNDFFASIARDDPQGNWPRYLSGQQLYWTVIGADGSPVEALVSEDGMVEVGDAHFSIEPFLWMNGKLVTWSDAQSVQTLESGYLPIPSVEWLGKLRVTASVDADSVLEVRYRLPEPARLYLAIRPLQVNPPWQFLKRIGGGVKVSHIAYANGRVTVDAEQQATIVAKPVAFGATTFDGGNVVEFLRRGQLPSAREVRDDYGYASAALEFDSRDVTIRISLDSRGGLRPPTGGRRPPLLNRVRIDVPEAKIFDSIRKQSRLHPHQPRWSSHSARLALL